MTLFRQLARVVVLLFGLVLAGTFAISIGNTRQYIERQLQSHAQDTATSLGLSLSPHLERGDWATIRAMVDAIFDRGYYRQIVILGNDGKPLLERVNSMAIQGVPGWFVDLVPLETPRGEALIVNGWVESGRLWLTSHPGLAYEELWRTVLDTSRWFLTCAAVALGLCLLLLRAVLKPLRAVEQQAEAICEGRYPMQDEMPETRELRQVVQAMNRMAARVQSAFEEQATRIEALRAQAYADPVTGLGNRRYFDNQLAYLIQAREEFASGALFLVQLSGFKAFNDRHGYAQGDELLRHTADMIRAAVAEYGDCTLARLGGADFAAVIKHETLQGVESLARRLSEDLLRLRAPGLADTPEFGHIGIGLYRPGLSASEFLALADQALCQAARNQPVSWRVNAAPEPPSSPNGARSWREFLEEAIQHERIVLSFQPVVALDAGPGAVLHREVLLRLRRESGELLMAAEFLPMAERGGLAVDFDRAAVKAVLRHMEQAPNLAKDYAVNLSPSSVRDPEFTDWLHEQLRAFPKCARRLILEIPEHSVLRDVSAAKSFIQKAQSLGARTSIDHFGRNFASFAYLHSMGARYLKVDGSFVRGLHLDQDNQFFLKELARAAHDINLQVIALNVEAEEEKSALMAIRFDALQGYLTGKPGDDPAQ